MRIQDLFDKYNKTHTCAVLMEDLWESKGVWFWLMTTKNIDVTLHGWKHDDYTMCSKEIIKDTLSICLDYWEENSKRAMDVYGYEFRPLKVFYPPWNKTSPALIEACRELGLEVNTKTRQSHPGEVWDFHWWEAIYPEKLKELDWELRK